MNLCLAPNLGIKRQPVVWFRFDVLGDGTPDQIEARLAVLRAELAAIPPDTAAYCRLVASKEVRSLEIKLDAFVND
jgi:hypothetical protein